MTRQVYSRRSALSLGLGAAALGLTAPRLRAQTATGLQLSWLHSVQFAGSYIAQERGLWRDAGLEVTLMQGGPNAPVEPQVISGAALVGISAADYTAAAVAEGAPFKIIAVAMQKNPFVIASLPGNPVETPADLPGRRIGMALANTPVLEAVCTLNGVDAAAVEVVPTQYSAQPLLAGEVDCLLCWETDLPVAMAVNGVESRTMLLADHGYAVHSQTYIATEDSLANRRADIVKLMAGEVAGWDAYRADTDAAADLTVRRFPDAGLDLDTQKLQAERQVPLMFSDLTDENGFGWWTEETVAANIETLALLGRDVTPDLWDRSILEEIHGG
ncbi:ABC transporter substrate-binding protein [Sulfitobacter sp. D35]|uniref:ABC transporter substrate-binding protein n=1 Tax=Sulfitobacter sp. D35 TaxID=3083252 RepID=UPI00296F1A45|nr:ABC transporter substrate-binding protein [Sulfitobacter sp. D35]MDW4497934.1 ABC transporter substrate-binding protein [Sulfitobacter sp. D35]